MLILPIKRKWFDMIASGEKKEEYREISPFYTARFELASYDMPFTIRFRNGYTKHSPYIDCKVRIYVGPGKEEWGASQFVLYYILEILEVVTVKERIPA